MLRISIAVERRSSIIYDIRNFVVMGLAVDLGSITSTSSPVVWGLGLVRDPVIQYATGTSSPRLTAGRLLTTTYSDFAGSESRSSYFWSKYSSIGSVVGFIRSPEIRSSDLQSRSTIFSKISTTHSPGL